MSEEAVRVNPVSEPLVLPCEAEEGARSTEGAILGPTHVPRFAGEDRGIQFRLLHCAAFQDW